MRGIFPLALVLTLTLGMIEPARGAGCDIGRCSLLGAAISRAVEAIVEVGEGVTAGGDLPALCARSGPMRPDASPPPGAPGQRARASRGESDLPPPIAA